MMMNVREQTIWQQCRIPLITLVISAIGWVIASFFTDWLTGRDTIQAIKYEMQSIQKYEMQSIQAEIQGIHEKNREQDQVHKELDNKLRGIRMRQDFYHEPGIDTERRTVRDWRRDRLGDFPEQQNPPYP